MAPSGFVELTSSFAFPNVGAQGSAPYLTQPLIPRTPVSKVIPSAPKPSVLYSPKLVGAWLGLQGLALKGQGLGFKAVSEFVGVGMLSCQCCTYIV